MLEKEGKLKANLTTMADTERPCSLINGTSGLQSAEFLTANIILLVISLVAVIISVGAIILLLEAAILKIQRILLANLVVTEMLTAAAGIVNKVNSIVLISTRGVEPSLALCRMTIWTNSVGISARMFGLIAYSMAFLLILKYGKQRMKPWVSVVMVSVVWLSALFITVDRLIPQTTAVRYLDNVRCLPSLCDDEVIYELRIALRVFWLVFVGAVPLGIAVVVPAIGYRRNREGRTTSPRHAKTARRLMAFLVAATSSTLLWMLSLLIWPILFTKFESVRVPGGYVVIIVETIAIIPTSLFIMMYMRQVHQLAGKIAKCCTGMCSNRHSQSHLADVEQVLSYRRVLQNHTAT